MLYTLPVALLTIVNMAGQAVFPEFPVAYRQSLKRFVLFTDIEGRGKTSLVDFLSMQILQVDPDGAMRLVANMPFFARPFSGEVFSRLHMQQWDFVDVDNDGDDDLVFLGTSSTDGKLATVLNQDGILPASIVQKPVRSSLPAPADRVIFADMNGDDIIDALTLDRFDKTVSLAFGNGAGGFIAQTIANGLLGKTLLRLSLRDLDGRPGAEAFGLDLATLRFELLSRTQSGEWVVRKTFPESVRVSNAVIGDINSDGMNDIVFSGAQMHIAINQGNFQFQSIQADLNGNSFRLLEIGDLNNDGQPELIGSLQFVPGKQLAIAEITNAGEFTITNTMTISGGEFAGVSGRLRLVDVNNDSRLDIVSDEDNMIIWNLGHGRFTSFEHLKGPQVAGASGNTLGVVTDAKAIDIDNDGDMDIVAASWVFGVTLLENRGDRIFMPRIIASDLKNSKLLLRDVTNDGQVDVVVASADQQAIIIFENNSGAFTEYKRFPTTGVVAFLEPLQRQGATFAFVWGSSEIGEIGAIYRDAANQLTESNRVKVAESFLFMTAGLVRRDDARRGDMYVVIKGAPRRDCGPLLHFIFNRGAAIEAAAPMPDVPDAQFAVFFSDLPNNVFAPVKLVVTHQSGSRMSLYQSTDKDFFLLSQQNFLFPSDPPLFKDLDQNGVIDALSPYGDQAFLFLGDGRGSFVVTQAVHTGKILDVADLDNDSDLDLISSASSSGLSVVWNRTREPFGRRCRQDQDADGVIGKVDLLKLLQHWGDRSGPSALLEMLSNWGVCPVN